MDVENMPSAVMAATIKQMQLEGDEVMEKRLEKLAQEEYFDVLTRMQNDPYVMAQQYSKLLRILAATYQIAGCHDAPDTVLDVLAYPEAATDAQVAMLLPYSPVQAAA